MDSTEMTELLTAIEVAKQEILRSRTSDSNSDLKASIDNLAERLTEIGDLRTWTVNSMAQLSETNSENLRKLSEQNSENLKKSASEMQASFKNQTQSLLSSLKSEAIAAAGNASNGVVRESADVLARKAQEYGAKMAKFNAKKWLTAAICAAIVAFGAICGWFFAQEHSAKAEYEAKLAELTNGISDEVREKWFDDFYKGIGDKKLSREEQITQIIALKTLEKKWVKAFPDRYASAENQQKALKGVENEIGFWRSLLNK